MAILIPAAGQSRRMRGRDKLLEPVEGLPLLRRQALVARATGAPVMITLPADCPARAAALSGLAGLCVQPLGDAAEGISASICAGARWARHLGAAGLMILLADLPELRLADLRAMLAGFAAAPDRALRATDADGRPGHPVILPARMLADLETLRGDDGARALLARDPPASLMLPEARATTDLDTPEDWAAWRARRAGGRAREGKDD
ncbi:MAG: nucleotidyltransferase family protein [Roseovarius sp.]